MQRETFGQRPRADAGWLEGLDDAENILPMGKRDFQTVGDVEQADGQITGLVNLVDDMGGDHEVGAHESGSGLRDQMVVERKSACCKAIKIGPVIVEAAAGGCAVEPEGAIQPRPAVGRTVMVEGFSGKIDIQRGVSAGSAIACQQTVRRQRVGAVSVSVKIAIGIIAVGVVAARLSVIIAPVFAFRFEQRIALQLFRDEGFDFQIGQRQQLDRLLQLRRHHQRLAVPQVEARAERHGYKLKPSPRYRRRTFSSATRSAGLPEKSTRPS